MELWENTKDPNHLFSQQKVLELKNGFEQRSNLGWGCKILTKNSERSKVALCRPFQTDKGLFRVLKECQVYSIKQLSFKKILRVLCHSILTENPIQRT